MSAIDTKIAKAQRKSIDAQTTIVGAARELDGLLYIEAYCQNPSCAVRDITIHIKDHDATIVRDVSVRGICCPVCNGITTVHFAITSRTHHERGEQLARWSVNEQMYVRDHCHSGLVVMPVSAMNDDRLPPTPDGWFSRLPTVAGKRRVFVSADRSEGK